MKIVLPRDKRVWSQNLFANLKLHVSYIYRDFHALIVTVFTGFYQTN